MNKPKPITCKECGETILPCDYVKCDYCFIAQDVVVIAPDEWKDLQLRAEIGARAVELLWETSTSAMMPKKYRPRIRTLVADSRAEGMIKP